MLAVCVRRRRGTTASARVLPPIGAGRAAEEPGAARDSAATLEVALLVDDSLILHVERLAPAEEDGKAGESPDTL
jgi:hypothetical protein